MVFIKFEKTLFKFIRFRPRMGCNEYCYQYSSQPKEFCYYRPPTFEMIVKAYSILTSESYPLKYGEIDVFWIRSRTKPGRQFQLRVEKNQAYTGFKFIWCNCIGFNSCYTHIHIVTLAIKENYKIKGFISVDTLAPNKKSGRKKATTFSGAEANLTTNKSQTIYKLRATYSWK